MGLITVYQTMYNQAKVELLRNISDKNNLTIECFQLIPTMDRHIKKYVDLHCWQKINSKSKPKISSILFSKR